MRGNIKQYFFIGFFVLTTLLHSGSPLYAQQQKDNTQPQEKVQELPLDNTPVNVRQVEPAKLEQFRQNKDFQYDREYRPGASLWDRFWYKVRQFFRNLFGSGAGKSVDYIVYALATGIAVYVILKLLKTEMTGLFGRHSRSMPLPYEAYDENIHEMDFASMIEEAVEQKDFRRAVRLYYLHTLKSLTDQAFIQWSPSKTNRSYLSEIQNQKVRQEFEKVTGMFEYVWYGGSSLSDQHFQATRQTFSDFNNLLGQQV